MRRRWGSGTIEKTPDERFRARFVFEPSKGREEVGVFDTYKEAEVSLDAVLASLANSPRGKTLRSLGKDVLDMRERSGYRSVKTDRQRWGVYVETWDLIDVPAKSISRGDVRRWLADLGKRGLATQTRRNALNVLRAVFEHGVEDELFLENPCFGMKVRDHGSTVEKSTALTLDEANALVEASGHAPEVTLALYTGARMRELTALHWSDVGDRNITLRFGRPGKPRKNGKIHTVPVLPPLAQALARVKRGSGLLFVNQSGRARSNLVHIDDWRAWLKKADIARRVRFHDLRHTCATLLLQGAWGRMWTLEEVKEMLDHSSVKVTERYAKANGSLAERAAAEMRKSKPRHGPEDGGGIGNNSVQGRLAKPSHAGSNPVLTSERFHVVGAEMRERLSGLSRAYLEAVADGDARALNIGCELAAVVDDAMKGSHDEAACTA